MEIYEEMKDSGGDAVRLGFEACGTLIRAIESEEKIPDIRLLSKICLIKEEILQVLGYAVGGESNAGVSMKNQFSEVKGVPEAEAAFVKELLQVSDPERRVALIKGAIMQNDSSKDTTIRPGIFLDCIDALRKGMDQDSEGRNNVQVKQRLDDIRSELIKTLEDISGDIMLMP